MESHIRVYIAANWDALGSLSCAVYKVLIALVQRADPFGRCFPSVEKIADDTDLHVRTVYAALETLEACRYIGYLRRNECDPVTGRFMPNVYIVSPHFICIGQDNQLESLNLWKSVFSDMPLPLPFESKVHTNQQQEPDTKNLHQRNNTRKQQQQPAFPRKNEDDADNSDDSQNSKKQKANRKKSENPNDSAQQKQPVGPQRSQDNGRSAKIKQNYANPDPMPAPLPDALQESLAERVNEYGIPIPLARGMILAHGFEPVTIAANQLDATAKRQDIGNKGGFFRYLLEKRILDSNLPDVLESVDERGSVKKYGVGRWAKFFEPIEDLEHETE